MTPKYLILAAASALSLVAAGGAHAAQIWYTTTGDSNVVITNRPGGAPNLFLPNVSLRYSVVGETSGAYDDLSTGVRLIAATSPTATVTGAGTGTVVPAGFHFPFSFTNLSLGLAGTAPGENPVFGSGLGANAGLYSYGSVTGSQLDFGDVFGGAGLAGWNGVSAIGPTPVNFIDGDTPSIDLINGATWNFVNLHDLTFTATVAGGAADTPLVVIDGAPDATSYTFDFSATGGTPVYIDPLVATGYDYVLGDDSPGILSAIFPTIGSSHYSIYALGDLSNPLFTNVLGGQTIDFTTVGYANGIHGFALRGVDVGAGVSPNDNTAFVTGLTFATGTVHLTQTAITTFVPDGVPEPATWAMLIAGFFGLGGELRRRRAPALAA